LSRSLRPLHVVEETWDMVEEAGAARAVEEEVEIMKEEVGAITEVASPAGAVAEES